MDKKINSNTEGCCSAKHFKHSSHHHSGSSPIYSLAVFGALFYFLQDATGFMEIIIGIGKSLFWPAVLMFELLTYFQI